MGIIKNNRAPAAQSLQVLKKGMVIKMIFGSTFTFKHNNVISGNQPVAVIANFAVNGRFMPIYFLYVSDDSCRYTYKIDGIKYTREKHDCILFCCLFTNEGVQHQVILTFYFNDCLWKLDEI